MPKLEQNWNSRRTLHIENGIHCSYKKLPLFHLKIAAENVTEHPTAARRHVKIFDNFKRRKRQEIYTDPMKASLMDKSHANLAHLSGPPLWRAKVNLPVMASTSFLMARNRTGELFCLT